MKYFSTFSGIGGFELGIQQAISSAECIGYSEIDKYAAQIYSKHFDHKNYGDITKINADELPDFDLFVGGFPCQSFSIAGKRGGFSDTRGTLFFEIARILKQKQPRLVLLENVKGLLSHDSGKTFRTIICALDELGYDLQWQVLNSKNFGVPQNRERVFIVGSLRGTPRPSVFPLSKHNHEYVEKVYQLSKGASSYIRELYCSRQEAQLLRGEMQTLLARIQQELPSGECREIQSEAEGLDTNAKGSVQIVEELNSWTQCKDNSGAVCGVVQIPTEDVLLLWARGEEFEISFRHLQQQDISFERGQDRLQKGVRSGEFSSLLLAVQSHQGRLFYSIGNGRDWQIIYSKSLEIWNNTLGSILEEHPDPKYFLSEERMKILLKNLPKVSQLLEAAKNTQR